MLIVVQFPLADLRPFIDDDTRLPSATEFAQTALRGTSDFGGGANAPFLPSVGPLRKRNQGAQFAGESLYFKARNALRFADDLRQLADPRDGAPIGVRVFFRRLQAFQDLHQLARCEVALLLDLVGRAPFAAADVSALLRRCLELPVSVPGEAAPLPLGMAGPPLAALLRRATTYRRRPAPPSWTLQACAPALLVEYGQLELLEPAAGSSPVALPEAPDLRLAGRTLALGPVRCSTWFLCTGVERVDRAWYGSDVEAGHRDRARQLRINLLRHHAEREVLAHTLDCVLVPDRLRLAQPGLPAAALESYLVRAAARLTRFQRYGCPQEGTVRAAGGIEAAATAVDAGSESRYRELWEHLASVLDHKLFGQLYEALPQLPMGSPIETAKLHGLLAASRSPPRQLAVSYAHADARLMQSFASHLEPAVRQGMVKSWDDRWIVAGTDWQAEIDQRFTQAQVVVLLVSEDFLKSTYCMQVEVPLVLARAQKGQALVVPVIVRPCAWAESALKSRQAVLPHGRPVVANGNRAEAWRIVIHEVLAAGRALLV